MKTSPIKIASFSGRPHSATVAPETSAAPLNARWQRLRVHKRILAEVKLLVEWEESNQLHSARAFTLDVSYSGCLAVVSADLRIAQTVKLIHRQKGSVAEARVIWRDPATGDVGLELLKPDATFWNL